jgi:hypothetical protein
LILEFNNLLKLKEFYYQIQNNFNLEFNFIKNNTQIKNQFDINIQNRKFKIERFICKKEEFFEKFFLVN